jgi:hypothetical protein
MRLDDPMPILAPRRAVMRGLLLALALPSMRATAQAASVATLRPGESIEIPGGRITVLGVDISRGGTTNVTLRLRALADAAHTLGIYTDTFRVLAADVPRSPAGMAKGDGPTSSFLVDRDSAIDFTVTFKLADKTDDLVFQVRVDGTVERRRLPAR